MNYFYLYTGLGVLLITVLAMNVTRIRWVQKIPDGDNDYLPLKLAIRTHMNNLEHIVPFALLIFSLSEIKIESIYLGTLAFGFISLRVLNSYSMLASIFKLRVVTADLTYLFEFIGCLLVIWYGFSI
ncbi:hypothetical protein NBRC116188_04630 [Oceaniserpentilla sp. 4NH20-0058]|uniref:MAPEG family protein n=1 Tax=Oceaniserpentilla sp. 4NH20-0058 TaxID=3127660 RepID=UPI003101D6C7